MEGNSNMQSVLGKFENLNFDSIECLNDVLQRLTWRDYKGWSIAMIIGAIILAIFVFWIELSILELLSMPAGSSSLIAILPILGALAYFDFLSNKTKSLFMKEFAKRNGLFYEPSLRNDDVLGNLFKVGHSRKITHALTGSYYGQRARFFYYTYSVGHGRHEITLNFTVMEIFFEKTEFPHILFQAGLISGRYGKAGENEIKIKLEEEFEKDFDLFVKDGYGIEAMQIFSKDFLLFLKEKNSNFSIELQGNRIYIYDNVLVTQKQQLQELFAVIGNLFGRMAPLLNRLDDDFAALHKHYNKNNL